LELIIGKQPQFISALAEEALLTLDGAALLAKDGWERRHELIFELDLHRA
jgi:hypothetical protein